MNRSQFIQLVNDEYNVAGEYLWVKYPNYCVFRHPLSRKWFAIVMDVERSKLGLKGSGVLDVVDLKCNPLLIGSLRKENGVFPAYHMSKSNWVSVSLNDCVSDEQVRFLLSMSYEATAPAKKTKKGYAKKEQW